MPHSGVAVYPGRRLLEPPAELGQVEAAEFRRVVASCPADHFSAEDLGPLCAYVRARVLERRASDELQAAAAIAGTQSPWLPVYREAIRALSTLAIRLRLGPKSRHPNKVRRLSKSLSPPSYYDTMVIPTDPQAPLEPREWPSRK